MSDLHVKYLLIGGGLASSSAVQAIRARDPDGALMLVGQEINRPYHRPPLSKEYLRRQKSHEQLFTLEPEWFAAHHVQLRTGRRASHLDTARKTVTLDSGEAIAFDKALLATGGSAAHLKVPGADLPNVYYLRTLEDTGRLHNAIDKARREGRPHDRGGRGRVAVVGGGVLGVELAASFTQLGLSVDLIASRAHPWSRFAGESTGRFITRYLQDHGVTVHVEQPPLRLEGDGRVQRVVLPGGTVEADFVVAAVGMLVNKELLRGTPIAAEHAILVDSHCRTNVEGIYAAGDCAAILDPLFGKYRALDHWDNAIVTGALAGRNMAGADEPYDAVNYFFSDVFELSLSGWGEAKLVDRRLIRGTPGSDGPDFIEIGIAADGRVAQVLAVGHQGDDQVLRELVRRRFHVEGNEEHLKDPSIKLADLLN